MTQVNAQRGRGLTISRMDATPTLPLFRNTSDRFAPATIALHWLTVVLIGAAYAAIELRELYPRGSELRELLKALHFALGLSVLLLLALRLGLRARAGPGPAIAPPPPRWQVLAARCTHGALYAFLAAMPLSGWLTASAKGAAISFFGIAVPALVAPDRGRAELFEGAHEALWFAGLALVALHAAAALLHHYCRLDNTLGRMLPR